jgi:flagellar protein FliO/FliZ
MTYSPELTGAVLKMALALLLVLAILWAVQRWARRNLANGPAGIKRRLVRVLGNHYLGVKKSITIVQVPGSILVLGIGAEQISLLSRIDDPQAIARIIEEEKPAGQHFGDHLQRFTRALSLKIDGPGPLRNPFFKHKGAEHAEREK